MEGRRARRRSRADLESMDSEDTLPPQEVLAPHKRRVQDPTMDPRIATVERPRTRGSTQLATQKLPAAGLTREEMRAHAGKATPGARSTEKQMLAISTREAGLGTVLDVDNAAFEYRSREPARAIQDQVSGDSTASEESIETPYEEQPRYLLSDGSTRSNEELESRCAAALGADQSVPKQKQTGERARCAMRGRNEARATTMQRR